MKEIVWTDIAENDLDLVLNYLKYNWSQKVINSFKLKLTSQIKCILQNPKQFPFLNKTRMYRKCVITRQNSKKRSLK